MATPASLSTAAEAYATQQTITAAAVEAARLARPQTPENIALVVAAYQLLAAQQGAAAVAPMLTQQGIAAEQVAGVVAANLAGFTAAGWPLSTMFEKVNSSAQLAMLVASAVQDAGRNGASLGIAVRPSVTGYVRMLNPPSCSRCVVLAGKFYRWNQGFERHPQCDCRHIPADENARDLTTNPSDYFESLSEPEQDRIFTKAGAQAIRDGADIGQVVNARRGMAKGQLFGNQVWHTFEGVTRRGRFRQASNAAGKKLPVRLMPESIYALAEDREDALRLLNLYGYIT